MISLFEPSSPSTAGMPIDLIAPGLRGVSLLTFVMEEPEPATELEPAQEFEVEAAPEFVIDNRAAQTAAMIEAAREQAVAETREACALEYAAALAEAHEQTRLAAREFAGARERYLADAEAEVVQLALAVARRVLAREAAADPMHLAAIVRAALARVHDGSHSTLRVAPGEYDAWRAAFDEEEFVQVAADERIGAGECALETAVGRVELGVEPQLRAVAAAFAELSSRRP